MSDSNNTIINAETTRLQEKKKISGFGNKWKTADGVFERKLF